MPWRLKSDMRHFRALTMGKPVVMGRKTYLSTSVKPLPARTNIVVTRDANFTAPGALVARSLEIALEVARGDALRRGSDIMVIGGAEIYAQAMPLADRLEITRIHMNPQGDTAFPPIDPAVWREAAREPHPAGEGDEAAFDFVSYVKANTQP
jgi:dihydrofolate reductase